MSPELIADVMARAETEADRKQHPIQFPSLPPVPAARYTDALFADLEHDFVFARSWLMVAHSDELPEAGDYRRVDQLPEPIVLVRDRDRQIRAFYNTCQHRGAALVTEQSGHAGRRLTCPYHSWVYDLDGTLVGYPETHNFPPLEPDCVALRAVRCETFGPLVFVNLDPDAAPLNDYLRPVSDDLSELAAMDGTLHLVGHPSLEIDTNWKLPVDANIETYHVNTVHRDSAAQILDQAATGIQLLPNGHSRMLIRTRDGRSMGDLMPFAPLFDGVGDLPDAGTFSYHVFPNLSIVFSGRGFVFFITNWPIDPDRSAYHVHYCSSQPPDTDEHAELNAAFVEVNQSVLLEDLTVLPGMQRSLDGGGIDVVRLGYHERRIYHLHERIDRAMGDAVPAELQVPVVLDGHVDQPVVDA